MEDFSVPADDDVSTCHAILIYRTWQHSKRAHMRCGNGFLAAANYEGGGAASKMSVSRYTTIDRML